MNRYLIWASLATAVIAVLGVGMLVGFTGGSDTAPMASTETTTAGSPAALTSLSSATAVSDFMISNGQPEDAPASEYRASSTNSGGTVWSHASYRTAKGSLCLIDLVPAEGLGFTCGVALVGKDPIVGTEGMSERFGGMTWIAGLVDSTTVVSVEAVLHNCGRVSIPINSDGTFSAFFAPVAEESIGGRVSSLLATLDDGSTAVETLSATATNC